MLARLAPEKRIAVHKPTSTFASAASSSATGPTEDSDSDDGMDEAFAALAEKREELAQLADAEPANFIHSCRGSDWTWEKKGVAMDVQGARARGKLAVGFCQLYGLERSFGCSTKSYSEPHIVRLAEEWCRKMQFFYDLYMEAEGNEIHFTRAMVDEYIERADYSEWVEALEVGSKAKDRALSLRKLSPSLAPLSVAEQAARKKRRKA